MIVFLCCKYSLMCGIYFSAQDRMYIHQLSVHDTFRYERVFFHLTTIVYIHHDHSAACGHVSCIRWIRWFGFLTLFSAAGCVGFDQHSVGHVWAHTRVRRQGRGAYVCSASQLPEWWCQRTGMCRSAFDREVFMCTSEDKWLPSVLCDAIVEMHSAIKGWFLSLFYSCRILKLWIWFWGWFCTERETTWTRNFRMMHGTSRLLALLDIRKRDNMA